jgi:hypothetical protein
VADGYFKRDAKNIARVVERFVAILEKLGFRKGRVLDAGCGFGAVAIENAKEFHDIEIVRVDLGEPLFVLGNLIGWYGPKSDFRPIVPLRSAGESVIVNGDSQWNAIKDSIGSAF